MNCKLFFLVWISEVIEALENNKGISYKYDIEYG